MFDMESLAIQRTKNNLNLEHAKAIHLLLQGFVQEGKITDDEAKSHFNNLCIKLGWHV